MMLRALRRGVPTTRFASSLSSLSRPIPLTEVESLVMSKDRTLLRVTQGGTVVLASLKARDDGRVGGGGCGWSSKSGRLRRRQRIGPCLSLVVTMFEQSR